MAKQSPCYITSATFLSLGKHALIEVGECTHQEIAVKLLEPTDLPQLTGLMVVGFKVPGVPPLALPLPLPCLNAFA